MKQRDRMHEFIGQLLATGAVGEPPVLPVLDDAIPAGETVAHQLHDLFFCRCSHGSNPVDC